MCTSYYNLSKFSEHMTNILPPFYRKHSVFTKSLNSLLQHIWHKLGFLLHYAIRIHWRYRQTDERTDVMLWHNSDYDKVLDDTASEQLVWVAVTRCHLHLLPQHILQVLRLLLLARDLRLHLSTIDHCNTVNATGTLTCAWKADRN